MAPRRGAAEGLPLCGGARRSPPFVDGYVASMSLVNFLQHLLLSLRPHTTVPVLAFQINYTIHSITELLDCDPWRRTIKIT